MFPSHPQPRRHIFCHWQHVPEVASRLEQKLFHHLSQRRVGKKVNFFIESPCLTMTQAEKQALFSSYNAALNARGAENFKDQPKLFNNTVPVDLFQRLAKRFDTEVSLVPLDFSADEGPIIALRAEERLGHDHFATVKSHRFFLKQPNGTFEVTQGKTKDTAKPLKTYPTFDSLTADYQTAIFTAVKQSIQLQHAVYSAREGLMLQQLEEGLGQALGDTEMTHVVMVGASHGHIAKNPRLQDFDQIYAVSPQEFDQLNLPAGHNTRFYETTLAARKNMSAGRSPSTPEIQRVFFQGLLADILWQLANKMGQTCPPNLLPMKNAAVLAPLSGMIAEALDIDNADQLWQTLWKWPQDLNLPIQQQIGFYDLAMLNGRRWLIEKVIGKTTEVKIPDLLQNILHYFFNGSQS